MQPETITLAVDELNNGTGVDKDFERFSYTQNRTVYVSEDHTPLSKDILALYRTEPKSSGNFPGVLKTALKFSQDLTVAGVDQTTEITVPLIVEVSFSVPVGAADADVLIARQRVVAILDRDDIMVELNSKQII
jgi:hypothetical protein